MPFLLFISKKIEYTDLILRDKNGNEKIITTNQFHFSEREKCNEFFFNLSGKLKISKNGVEFELDD